MGKGLGEFVHEPVLGFLHKIHASTRKGTQFLQVAHINGNFRASKGHVVVVVVGGFYQTDQMANLQVGDKLSVLQGGGSSVSNIISIQNGHTEQGLYAPLTASGLVVVDDVIASNYAMPSATL